jgi:signal transduction histidine kinase
LTETKPSRPRSGVTPQASGIGEASPAGSRARLLLQEEGTILETTEEAVFLLGPEATPGSSVAAIFPAAARDLQRALQARPPCAFALAPLGGRGGRALALACWPRGSTWEAEVLSLEGGPGREAAVLSELLHDLRTPLTTLLGAADLLAGGRLGAIPERMSPLLGAVAAAANQITEMLDRAAARRDAPTERGDA